MCIRDRACPVRGAVERVGVAPPAHNVANIPHRPGDDPQRCLLYTSDAADERSSVDLGGRRIIKKKKQEKEDIGSRRNKLNTTQQRNVEEASEEKRGKK